MADSPEEFSTPKLLNGEGDGIKNITVRRRLPTSSSRKFNARVNPDVTFKSKIGNALSELQTKSYGHSGIKKSQSVAEITPSKSKVKKRPIKTTSDDYTAMTLHATPRPMDGPPASPPRRCLRERAVCTVYQRLLLCVWRRSRARLTTLSDSCGRQQDQIGQLEIQVDVLKNLRNSESQKRTEALNDSQQLKKKIDVMELEKCRLSERLRNTQEELENTQTNLNLTKLELKKCSEQIGSYQEQLKRKKEERIDLLTKISTQDYEINKKNSIIYRLEGELKTIEKNLQNSESSFKAKQEEYSEVLHQLQDEVELNYSLNEQLLSLQEDKVDLESQTRDLENQLSEYIESCEQLRDENTTIKSDLNEISFVLLEERRKTWFKNTKEIAVLSLTALQKVAYVLLPAYLDNPV